MTTSYEYFKNGGAKEMPLEKLPKEYGWITSDGGGGYYWNFFMTDKDLREFGVDPKKTIMCKIR